MFWVVDLIAGGGNYSVPDRLTRPCLPGVECTSRAKHDRCGMIGLRDEVVNFIVAVPRARNRCISGKLTETRDAAQSELEFSRKSVMVGANFATSYVLMRKCLLMCTCVRCHVRMRPPLPVPPAV